jgi:hypothetical protein
MAGDKVLSSDASDFSTKSDPLDPSVGEGEHDDLILWFLSLTPTQRLQVLQDFLDGSESSQTGLILRVRQRDT